MPRKDGESDRAVCTYYIRMEVQKDLRDLSAHSGESMSALVCKGIVALIRKRIVDMKPTTPAADRLIARYGKSKE